MKWGRRWDRRRFRVTLPTVGATYWYQRLSFHVTNRGNCGPRIKSLENSTNYVSYISFDYNKHVKASHDTRFPILYTNIHHKH